MRLPSCMRVYLNRTANDDRITHLWTLLPIFITRAAHSYQDGSKPPDNPYQAQSQRNPNPPLRAGTSSKIMTEEIALNNQSRDLLNINQHQINHGGVYRPCTDISYRTCER